MKASDFPIFLHVKVQFECFVWDFSERDIESKFNKLLVTHKNQKYMKMNGNDEMENKQRKNLSSFYFVR